MVRLRFRNLRSWWLVRAMALAATTRPICRVHLGPTRCVRGGVRHPPSLTLPLSPAVAALTLSLAVAPMGLSRHTRPSEIWAVRCIGWPTVIRPTPTTTRVPE